MLVLMLVGCTSGTSKLRLELLDENTERNFCLSHFLGDLSLFGGVDMARRSVIDGTSKRCIFAYIIFTAYSRVNISGISHVLIISFSLMVMCFYVY